jgi:hypothetical protein
MEQGNYQLPDGRHIEVGSVSTAAIRHQNGTPASSFQSVNFSELFQTAPLVFNTIQTANGDSFEEADLFGTRMNGVPTTSGFQVAMEDYQADTSIRTTAETIGWVAIEPGVGTWDGVPMEVGVTGASVNEGFSTINFANTYGSIPLFIAAQATFNGADATQLRQRNLTATSAQVRAAEDTHGDAELGHAAEQVSYLVLDASGQLGAAPFGATPGAFTYDPNGAFDGLAPGATGTDTFSYVLVDENGNADTNTVTITVTGTATIIGQWRIDNGFSDAAGSGLNEGNFEDKEGDGLSNLQEFAFGTNPMLADDELLTVDLGGGTFTPGRVITLNDGTIWGVFIRRADHVAAGLVYTPQFIYDLNEGWLDDATVPTVLVPADSSGYEVAAVPYALFPQTEQKRTYFRVKVEFTQP